jgi:hypothetical protein
MVVYLREGECEMAGPIPENLQAVADAIMHDIIAEDIRLEQRRPKHAKRTVPASSPQYMGGTTRIIVPEPPQRSRSGSWWPRNPYTAS